MFIFTVYICKFCSARVLMQSMHFNWCRKSKMILKVNWSLKSIPYDFSHPCTNTLVVLKIHVIYNIIHLRSSYGRIKFWRAGGPWSVVWLLWSGPYLCRMVGIQIFVRSCLLSLTRASLNLLSGFVIRISLFVSVPLFEVPIFIVNLNLNIEGRIQNRLI